MRIVISLVTFNNSRLDLDLYERGFRAAARAVLPDAHCRLIYTDNGEPSGIAARIEEAVSLPGQGNVGYGPALHRIVAEAFDNAAADVVVTSNPDGVFHHGCLVRLLARIKEDPVQLLEARQFPSEHPKPYDPRTGATSWASGCCIALSRAVFDAVGNVDPTFWLYLEDVDYSWRARAAGVPVRIVPEALFAHDVTGRTADASARRQMLLSGRVLGRKWGNDKFLQWCERELRRAGESIPTGDVDPLRNVVPVPAAWRQIADFDNPFVFGGQRW